MSARKSMKLLIIANLLLSPFSLSYSNNINTGGQDGLVRSMTSRTMGLTGIHFGASLKYDRDMDYISGPLGTDNVIDNSTGNPVDRETPHIFSGDIYLSYGLFSILDFSVDLPLYFDIAGWDDKTKAGVGDLGIALKLAQPNQKKNAFFTNGYYCKITFPTGEPNKGYFPRHSYYQKTDGSNPGENQYTADAILVNPMLLWTLDFNGLRKPVPFKIHANLGGVVTKVKNSSAVVASVAMEVTPVDVLTIFAELSGEARIKYYTEYFSVKSFRKDPFMVSPGLRFNFPNGMYTTVAGDIGISSKDDEYRSTWNQGDYSYSTSPLPTYGVQLSLGWKGIIKEPDSDGDGFIDKEDRCPKEAEDKDGFKDDDGCPELDNDEDGILDSNDKCPLEKATCDGCPVYDKDEDGLIDEKDKCPEKAEDMDGFEDEDGCPDEDNDKDGINDKTDSCPNKPEDMDEFEDFDGCPEDDNDKDGIPDSADVCPNRRGVPEAKGCPKAKKIKRGKLVLGGVNFQSGKAILTPNSYRILDKVHESLMEWTEVKLEIRGYTDSRGNNESNRKLSQRRAESVMRYLVNKGVDSSRIRAKGFGEADPIADNTTAAGRAQNRRVELNRID